MWLLKKISLIVLMVTSFVIFGFTGKVDASAVDDLVVEMNSSGKILKGKQFEADKPIFRPVYQGDYKTIFEDTIGPKGVFKGYYNPKNSNGTNQNLQTFTEGDTLLLKNVGSFNGKKVALKITFFFTTNPYAYESVGVLKDGGITIIGLDKETKPITYQLVYDTPGYPRVPNIYLDLPIEYTLSGAPLNQPGSYVTISRNLRKFYLTLEDSLWSKVTRNYSLRNISDIFNFESNFREATIKHSSSIITDNDYPTAFTMTKAYNYETSVYLFQSSIKAPYVVDYLPVRVNGQMNSTKFEANYDVGQTVSDTYDDFFPETLKIIAEDKEGYFKKLDQKNFVFKDKDGIDITQLVTVKKVSNNKLEFTLSKDSLKILKSNQVNIKLSLDNLDFDKVIKSYDLEKKVYNVPLTFYNVRTKSNIDKKSEETKVDATITPNIYGEAKPTEVLVGTSTSDLNPLDLIENGVTTIPGDTLDVRFVESQTFTDVGTYNVKVLLSSKVTAGLTKTVVVPVTAVKGSLVTSADFENQSWIIDEINRQLAPKKIDKDVYKGDLSKITIINMSSNAKYPTEHIPFTIGQLTNLTSLTVANLNLVGSLPEELGDLSKLTKLAIYGNQFTSGIPESLGKLTHLKILSLYNNNLTGTVPRSIGLLPELKQISINDNQLIGQLPDFHLNMELIALNNNQLTYNKSILPTFLTSAKLKAYTNTFIDGLLLTGNAKVSSKVNEIKPFNVSDSGYFNLKAIQGMNVQNLYENHTYTIKDAKTGIVYYTGKKDIQAKIPYSKGILYKVILDEAEENNNNLFYIQGKEDEFKFAETPVSLSIKTKLGNKIQPVVLDGKLAIFDNRENENWKISITPSILTQGQRQLKGEYSYTSKDGQNHPIINGQKFLLEKGKSDSVNEIIPISNIWNDKYGLKYLTYMSNYVGNYRGTVEWTLENAP